MLNHLAAFLGRDPGLQLDTGGISARVTPVSRLSVMSQVESHHPSTVTLPAGRNREHSTQAPHLTQLRAGSVSAWHYRCGGAGGHPSLPSRTDDPCRIWRRSVSAVRFARTRRLRLGDVRMNGDLVPERPEP